MKHVTKVGLQLIITRGCCSLVPFIFTKYLATETSDQLMVRNMDTRGWAIYLGLLFNFMSLT